MARQFLRYFVLASGVIFLAWWAARFKRTLGQETLPGDNQAGVHYGPVTVLHNVPPHGFFDLPLPTDEAGFETFRPPTHPPRYWVQPHLCDADPAVLARIDAAMGTGSADGEVSGYVEMAEDCPPHAALVALAHDAGSASPTRLLLYAAVLAQRDLPALAPFANDPRVPLRFRARWRGRFGPTDTVAPEFAEALRNAAADGGGGAIIAGLDFVDAVDRPAPSPAMEATLLSLFDSMREGTLKRLFTRRLMSSPSPRLRARAAAACTGPRCETEHDAGSNAADVLAGFSGHPERIWGAAQADGGLPTIAREALGACALQPGHDAELCLTVLAEVDWALARQLAPGVRPPGPTAALVTAFESREAGATELARLGIDLHGAPLTTLSEALSVSQSGTWAAVENGYPARDDAVAGHYSTLAAGALHDVAFLEAVPDSQHDGNLLRAWMDRDEYRAEVRFSCNERDVFGIVGLLNQLLKVRTANVRCYVVRLGDRGVWVVALAPAAVARLVELRLLKVLRPGDLLVVPPRDGGAAVDAQ